jgi:chromosome segregation ATPase
MFGSKKIQELEARVQELTESLSRRESENADLTQQLDSAKSRIAEMEAQLNDFDLEQAKEAAKASRAEFEGLKDLYSRKNREFDEFKEEEEQRFARDQALQRHNLENEIRDNRQANQEYVANTVKTFGESYNYYLNQIKVLMDALGNVATRTGAALFSG